jgi:hypothetical protein
MSLRKRKKSHGKKRAEDEFCFMEPDDLKVAKTYYMYFGERDDECLVWEIVKDGSFLLMLITHCNIQRMSALKQK